jgi:hypothetical protein
MTFMTLKMTSADLDTRCLALRSFNMKREFFWQLLSESSHELAERTGSDVIFAAPLATLIQRKLRQKLADDSLELAGPIYGPALFPELLPEAYGTLKFRAFLEVFPDLVEVFRGPSGDMVRVVKGGQAVKADELRVRYRELLSQAMRELAQECNELTVPAVQLAKHLKSSSQHSIQNELVIARLSTGWKGSQELLRYPTANMGGGYAFWISNRKSIRPRQASPCRK